MIEFVKPTSGLIKIISQDMRKSDIIEVNASHGHTPLEALNYSFEMSDYSVVAISEGVPVSMLGVSISNITTGLGHPWMLSSNGVFNHKEYLLKRTAPLIKEMLSICPRLMNYVHHANKVSIKWLKGIGFTVEDAVPFGIKNDLFHKFHMEVMQCVKPPL